MKYSKVLQQAIGNVLNGPVIKAETPLTSPLLHIRLVVPKISVPTILDSRFTQFIEEKTKVTINPSKIIRTHEELPFDVLECNDVPINRLELFAKNMSKLLNTKDIDRSFQLNYNYNSKYNLKTKLLIPIPVLKKLRKVKDFKKANKDRAVYIESLNSEKEAALQIRKDTQASVLSLLIPPLLKYQQELETESPCELLDTIDKDVMVLNYRSVLKILERKMVIEHQTGCTIEVPKYHENYNMDDLLEVHVKGYNRFNTVKGTRGIALCRE